MPFQVLVAYATKHGSTIEIAQKIGDVLKTAGLQVSVLPAEKVTDVTPYEGIVLGSAVYEGKWRKEAVQFLEDYNEELTKIPVWLFSSGPAGKGNPVDLAHGWHFPDEQLPIADHIHARDLALFNGVIDMDKLNFAEKVMVKNFNTPGGDFRDWNAINQWAVSIAAALRPEVAE